SPAAVSETSMRMTLAFWRWMLSRTSVHAFGVDVRTIVAVLLTWSTNAIASPAMNDEPPIVPTTSAVPLFDEEHATVESATASEHVHTRVLFVIECEPSWETMRDPSTYAPTIAGVDRPRAVAVSKTRLP